MIGKIILLAHKNHHSESSKKKIYTMKRILMDIEKFHESFMLCVFICLFDECVEITIKKNFSQANIQDKINKLWLMIENDEHDGEVVLTLEEARELKTYFAQFSELGGLQNALERIWQNIVKECKEILI